VAYQGSGDSVQAKSISCSLQDLIPYLSPCTGVEQLCDRALPSGLLVWFLPDAGSDAVELAHGCHPVVLVQPGFQNALLEGVSMS
jgi:hypothetical protein